MIYVYFAMAFYAGLFIGLILQKWISSKTSYSGIIYVTKNEEKTLYSLELNDYPETIEFRKEVVFKVETSEEEPDRD